MVAVETFTAACFLWQVLCPDSFHILDIQPFNTRIYFCAICLLFRVLFRMGEIVVELYWQHSPNTCRNFAELARRKYYDGVKFHRIIPDFMIQGGDPTGTGRGGASIYGRTFKDEIHPELFHTGTHYNYR